MLVLFLLFRASLTPGAVLLVCSATGVKRKRTAMEAGSGKSAKLMVKNLAFEATRKDVRELFGSYGRVRWARAMCVVPHRALCDGWLIHRRYIRGVPACLSSSPCGCRVSLTAPTEASHSWSLLHAKRPSLPCLPYRGALPSSVCAWVLVCARLAHLPARRRRRWLPSSHLYGRHIVIEWAEDKEDLETLRAKAGRNIQAQRQQ